MKCKGCDKEHEDIDIKNYVVKYESWEAYNCCSENCAKNCANRDSITDDEIRSID